MTRKSPHMQLRVGDIRKRPETGEIGVYIGRNMPGQNASPLGNPLPLIGKTWNTAAQHAAETLALRGSEPTAQAAREALKNKGWPSGLAGGQAYAEILQLQCQAKDSPQRAELERIKTMLKSGSAVVLQCWCNGAAHCHGQVIKERIINELNEQISEKSSS